jgi:hypothetical protein
MAGGIETVLGVLEAAGFERLPKPLIVAGATFDFDAAAKGTGASHDLVVVAVGPEAPQHLLRLLAGLSRTLDQVGSRRPVSLVIVGEPLTGPMAANLERHARVLEISSDDPEPDEVRQAVAVLLPLPLAAGEALGRDPLGEVAEIIGLSLTKGQRKLLDAAKVGPDAVRETLRQQVDAAANGESDDGATL